MAGLFTFTTQDPKYDIAVQMNADTGEPSAAFLINAHSNIGIPTTEPIFILRGKDIHAIPTIENYCTYIKDVDHKASIWKRLDVFKWFKSYNLSQMKEPDTAP